MKNIKTILWDFDGVILESMSIRDSGFEKVLEEYPKDQVKQLLDFHRLNGGLSRYVKFRYFFENIRGEDVTEEAVLQLAERFSKIMKELLVDRRLLIEDSLNFINNESNNILMHIVSGSDGTELRLLCKELGISDYFKSIDGSPTPKKILVQQVLSQFSYCPESVVLVGDSINEYEAAVENGIRFWGYNNTSLMGLGDRYVTFFSSDPEIEW